MSLMVHIGKNGRKYHRASCRMLPQEAVQVPLRLAQARGYASCRACRPVATMMRGRSLTARTVSCVIKKGTR